MTNRPTGGEHRIGRLTTRITTLPGRQPLTVGTSRAGCLATGLGFFESRGLGRDVDVMGPFRRLGENGHALRRHRQEATGHRRNAAIAPTSVTAM